MCRWPAKSCTSSTGSCKAWPLPALTPSESRAACRRQGCHATDLLWPLLSESATLRRFPWSLAAAASWCSTRRASNTNRQPVSACCVCVACVLLAERLNALVAGFHAIIGTRPRQSVGSQWSCFQCTFLNEAAVSHTYIPRSRSILLDLGLFRTRRVHCVRRSGTTVRRPARSQSRRPSASAALPSPRPRNG